jgi:D-alanyl-D-alanine carboxypeptidase
MPGKRQRAWFRRWWLPGCVVLLLMAFQLRPVPAADLTQVVQTVLDEAQRQYGFPGATAAYVLPDGTVGVVATGLADGEAKTPMTVRSLRPAPLSRFVS